MELYEQLKNEYLEKINAMMDEKKQKSNKLRKDGYEDEAVLEAIKANVVDIFYKIFDVSYNKTCKGVEEQKIKFEKLSKTYLDFFDKICSPWKDKMSKDKQYDMLKELYIEEVKLDTADSIKELFIACYSSYLKED